MLEEEKTTDIKFSNVKSKCISLTTRIKNTPLPLIRKVLKASIALLVSLILVLVNNTRVILGPANTLVTLGVLLYFPVRPVGTNA